MAGGDGVELSEEAMVLSQVSKSIQGDGYSYSRMDCVAKQICSIKLLEQYPHLRLIDLSGNSVEDVSPLCKLSHVLSLNLASNKIASIDSWAPEDLQHLLFLDLSGNQLTCLPPLHMPALRRANFCKNQIASCEQFGGHATLKTLVLSENKLTSVIGLAGMPQLETLELGQNSLQNLEGLQGLPELQSLNISKNSFESLDGPWKETPKLASLDASGNAFAESKVFVPLARLPLLRRFQVAGSPLDEQDGLNIRLEILICHDGLLVINDEEVQPEEKDDAKALNDERIEEEARLAAEAAAAAAAAAGGGEGGEE
eukprot:TRINITY_DN5165_c0_g1_i1.p1 TRINITY_DN5165_c0_g1~~TRINITY_DN5165_c0_g1_i1.p1  ORF type:complete len:325 (+),score=109.74 TRINITY_DN5165_c0_g1_i1:38-976(+)